MLQCDMGEAVKSTTMSLILMLQKFNPRYCQFCTGKESSQALCKVMKFWGLLIVYSFGKKCITVKVGLIVTPIKKSLY